MNKVIYNLTFWQRIELIPLRMFWLLYVSDKRKTWHEVKKGMEKHKCNFVIPQTEKGYNLLVCDHEGCYMCDIVEVTYPEHYTPEVIHLIEQIERMKGRIELMKKLGWHFIKYIPGYENHLQILEAKLKTLQFSKIKEASANGKI